MAGEGNSVTVFGDLSKPATVLIEKVSSAVGILFEPKRITRKAIAESEAKKISALAELELTSELEKRAIARLIHQEARKQQNIEDITAEAISALPATAKPEDLNEDWVAHFFKQCETVSDKEMQTLWSKLLAKEASKPGTISKRTVNCVSSLSKADAELFTNFCQFKCFNGAWLPLIFDESLPIYKAQNLTFSDCMHLESLGLISFSGNLVLAQQKSPSRIRYFDQQVTLTYPKDDADFKLGKAIFTQSGRELSPICGAQANPEFFMWLLGRWVEEGISVCSAYPKVTI